MTLRCTVDKDVWKNGESLYKILDLKKNIVAFFYFSISDDVCTIHLFDVVPKYSKSEIGKEIINQFLVEYNVNKKKIRIDNINSNCKAFEKFDFNSYQYREDDKFDNS